ncbi:hypothetical protein SAMN05421805_12137 [Saccharopolyspora antimicrobica]|uniref:Uncharacterized protein n=1 Tax=Saccharopolyspora antimicrobica TaxID=455193 RepID=A0A1I5J3Q5_9PSEU|nr:hypothetical protein [Saccharopolyspora antimicrobica]SFO67387.1 hypothetical protein SAMN05421805_12137 [Saccharopolyspora antimicrobica]
MAEGDGVRNAVDKSVIETNVQVGIMHGDIELGFTAWLGLGLTAGLAAGLASGLINERRFSRGHSRCQPERLRLGAPSRIDKHGLDLYL